jgi:hypothetical protein
MLGPDKGQAFVPHRACVYGEGLVDGQRGPQVLYKQGVTRGQEDKQEVTKGQLY